MTNKSYFYACGNAIRRGPGVCTFGQVSRDALERAVVAAVVRFYDERYGGSVAKVRRAVQAMLGADRTRAAVTQGDLRQRLEKAEGTVRNLLDNITAANRAIIDRRLVELAAEQEELRQQLEAADRLAVSDEQVREAAVAAHRSIEALMAVLDEQAAPGNEHVRRGAIASAVRRVDLSADGSGATVCAAALPEAAERRFHMTHVEVRLSLS